MLSLQGNDSRSEYRTTERKHFFALTTAAIVYNVLAWSTFNFVLASGAGKWKLVYVEHLIFLSQKFFGCKF